MLNEKLSFLLAPRFIAMIVGALSVYAQTKGWIGEAEMVLIATITAGFIAVRTIDRGTEKIGGE